MTAIKLVSLLLVLAIDYFVNEKQTAKDWNYVTLI